MGDKLEEKVTVESLYHTCSACPSQWQGRTKDGKHIYVRFRWGHLTIGVGETFEDAVHTRELVDLDHGDGFDGCMKFEELVGLTQDKINWLDPKDVVEGDPPDATE